MRGVADHDRRRVAESPPDLANDAVGVEMVAANGGIARDHRAVGTEVHRSARDDAAFTQADHLGPGALGGSGDDRGRPQVHAEAIGHVRRLRQPRRANFPRRGSDGDG